MMPTEKLASSAKQHVRIEARKLPTIRMTVELPETVYDNLSALSNMLRISKKELVITAATKYLINAGLQPDKYSRLVINYASKSE